MPKLLRLQVEYTKLRGAVVGDDRDVTTHDFQINDAVWPDAGGAGTHNAATLEGDFRAFWTSLIGSSPSRIGAAVVPATYKWYREDDGKLPFGPAFRTQDIAAGLGGAGATCPPQVASTVTEITDWRKRWGRFYVPGIASPNLNADGSLTTAAVTHICTAATALYNAWRTRGVTPIVLGSIDAGATSIYGVPLGGMAGGRIYKWISGSLEQTSKITLALPVRRLRVDDVLDVQRSRRFQTPLQRVTSADLA